MTLFDDIPRSETRPKRENEPSFQYHNSSARGSVSAIRDLLEGWYRRFPDDAKPDLRGRFRSTLESQHQAAFFELYVHELLSASGFEVQVHPETETPRSTRPDFLILRSGTPIAYVEATLASRSRAEVGEQARIAQVYDSLNELDSPNFFLGLRLHGAPATPPPGAQLRSDLGRWLAALDPDEIAAQLESEGIDGLPTYEWSHDGWVVTFFPMPKGPAARGRPGVRPIGVRMPEFRLRTPHRAIQSAVAGKGKKYGELPLPLIVAVNVLDLFADEIDVMNGLLGEENITFTQLPDGSVTHTNERNPNGAWFGPHGPRNRSVSAALIVETLDAWQVGDRQPLLIHHPWARHPLDPGLWPLPQRVADLDRGQLVERPGMAILDVLTIPTPWPASES